MLGHAGLGLTNVVRLTYHATDVDRYFEAFDALIGRLAAAGFRPARTLLGVTPLRSRG